MQKLMSYMRSAMEKYNMIRDGDKVAVGVSGGKDSLALLCALAEMRRFYPHKYELVAISLDPLFMNTETDYSSVAELCRRLKVPYTVIRTDLYRIIFEERKEKNPCSLCAIMRRGILHDAAKAQGCNKLALGHHMDDAVETFYMNLLNGGKISCFSPISYLSRKDLYLIRPMVFATEKDVVHAVTKLKLPIVKAKCPVDGKTERQNVKELLKTLEKDYSSLRKKSLGALQRGGISDW